MDVEQPGKCAAHECSYLTCPVGVANRLTVVSPY